MTATTYGDDEVEFTMMDEDGINQKARFTMQLGEILDLEYVVSRWRMARELKKREAPV